MKNTEKLVPQAFLDKLFKKIACGSLDMYDPTKSSAETFWWRNKAWIATGGTSLGDSLRAESVNIREVLPDALWHHPYNDIDARGRAYYTGGRFYPKGGRRELWVITKNEIRLNADPAAPPPIRQAFMF